jgi:pyridoxine 5-phosphate synthase
MVRLSVNLNKIALLRNTRALGIPDLTRAARIALDAGAHGITVHPRPDERHIRGADVPVLAAQVRARPGVEFNIEGNPYHNLLEHALASRPDQCTLVPDALDAATSDHGWDLERHATRLRPIVGGLRELGIRVSLFLDPDPEQMARAAALGAQRVELYTESWARAHASPDPAVRSAAALRYATAARAALAAGLGINAGHDLNRDNLPDLVAAIPGLEEVSIGHALIADALELGLSATVRAYLAAIDEGLRRR